MHGFLPYLYIEAPRQDFGPEECESLRIILEVASQHLPGLACSATVCANLCRPAQASVTMIANANSSATDTVSAIFHRGYWRRGKRTACLSASLG